MVSLVRCRSGNGPSWSLTSFWINTTQAESSWWVRLDRTLVEGAALGCSCSMLTPGRQCLMTVQPTPPSQPDDVSADFLYGHAEPTHTRYTRQRMSEISGSHRERCPGRLSPRRRGVLYRLRSCPLTHHPRTASHLLVSKASYPPTFQYHEAIHVSLVGCKYPSLEHTHLLKWEFGSSL